MQSNICLFLYLLKAQTHTYRGINCIVGQIYLALQMFHICFHFNDSPLILASDFIYILQFQ
jgi:hypothetical protein